MPSQEFAGKRILITAGPTREFLDPVRFISNPSTGKMGYALACAAQERGAEVVLISGPVALPAPEGVKVINVVSAQDMLWAVIDELAATACAVKPRFDVMIFSAAVSDYKPVVRHDQKIKKKEGREVVEFERTPDILAFVGHTLGHAPWKPYIVGFAAETENVIENARLKLEGKNADMIVANSVANGQGFGADDNEVTLVTRDAVTPLKQGSKPWLATSILQSIVEQINRPRIIKP